MRFSGSKLDRFRKSKSSAQIFPDFGGENNSFKRKLCLLPHSSHESETESEWDDLELHFSITKTSNNSKSNFSMCSYQTSNSLANPKPVRLPLKPSWIPPRSVRHHSTIVAYEWCRIKDKKQDNSFFHQMSFFGRLESWCLYDKFKYCTTKHSTGSNTKLQLKEAARSFWWAGTLVKTLQHSS